MHQLSRYFTVILCCERQSICSRGINKVVEVE